MTQQSPSDYRMMAGLRGGLNAASMSYSDPNVWRYLDSTNTQFHGMGGAFMEIQIGNSGLAVRPELSLVGRGTRLKWLDVDYVLSAKYLDVRVPVTYSLKTGKNWEPYVMAVPQWGAVIDGNINYTAYDYHAPGVNVDLTSADIFPGDLGIMLGAGVDWLVKLGEQPLVLSLEAGYNWGLINSFANRENIDANGVSGANPPSVIANPFFGAELWHGSRHNRGIEVAVRVGIPFNKKVVETPPPPVDKLPAPKPIKPDTVFVTVHDTVTQTNTIKETIEKNAYRVKNCYSITEMYSFITLGIDISDKRICIFNINFDFDSYKLRPESTKPLNEVLMLMNTYPEINIEVYGHTDSIGTAEYNQRLSENRAQAAANYLIEHGIDPSRIHALGFGLEYPIDTNETEEGRFHNRRVEFEVLNVENIKRD